MNKEIREAARYSLILETIDGNKYYFDLEKGTFVRMYEKSKPYKTSLPALDIFTSCFDSQEQLHQMFMIDSPIKKMYISYVSLREQRKLAPVFDNAAWAELARSYREINVKSKSGAHIIDFQLRSNKKLFDEFYKEVIDPDSDFYSFLVYGKGNNGKKPVNMSYVTRNTLIGLRGHEGAIVSKNKDMFGTENDRSVDGLPYHYIEDKQGFYDDLKRCLSDYREFRALYLTLCWYKDRQRKKNEAEERKKLEGEQPKVLGKTPIIPPQQLSFFDKINE